MGNCRENEKDGFIAEVKSWPAWPQVVGRPYRPGPGPRSLASIMIDFDSSVLISHLENVTSKHVTPAKSHFPNRNCPSSIPVEFFKLISNFFKFQISKRVF